MMRIVSHAPPAPSSLRPGLPPAVDAVFDRVLAKKPAERFESCGAFAAALREALLPTQTPAVDDAPTVFASQPVLAAPAPAPVGGDTRSAASSPSATGRRPGAGARRRAGRVSSCCSSSSSGVNSVVLALVVWDKVGAKLPLAGAFRSPRRRGDRDAPPRPDRRALPGADPAPIVVVEQTPRRHLRPR